MPLADRVPRLFLRFLLALVHKRRQMLIPEIATEFHNLVDQSEGRIHANVTVARETSDEDRNAIAEQLSKVLGKPLRVQVNDLDVVRQPLPVDPRIDDIEEYAARHSTTVVRRTE